MKLLFLFLLVCCTAVSAVHAAPANDSTAVADSLAKAKLKMKAYQDSVEKAMLAITTYPLIKSAKYTGVLTVSNIDEKPDATQRFKLLLEITKGIKDSAAAQEINDALQEVGRQINLHIAAGVPKKNLDIVVVAHGGVLKALYTDEMYNKKYNRSNPNDSLLNELKAAGAKFIVCGQAMHFLNIEKEQMVPWVHIALSAQTTITDYQMKGYVHRDLSN